MNAEKKVLIFVGVLLPILFGCLVNLSPGDQDLFFYNRQSVQAYKNGNLLMEMEALERILEYRPWQEGLWQRLGRLQLTSGNYEEALAAFQQARQSGNLDLQGNIWMADTLIALGKNDEASQILDSLSTSGDLHLYLQATSLQRRINDFSGALNTLYKAYALDPAHAEVNYQLGLLLASEEPDKAPAHLEIAKRTPEYGVLCGILIDLINQTKEIAGTAERLIYIGQTLSQAGEWDTAARAFSNAATIDDHNVSAWALLGEAQQRIGGDGFDSLERASSIDPENELVNGLWGMYYQRQQKTEVALVYFSKALEANPNAPVWEIETANTLASMGELEKAKAHFQTAIQIDQADWTSWRSLAVFCVTHNYEIETTGINSARQALVLNPDSPALLDLMGTLYMAVGDLDSAERFFNQADKLDPDQAAILIHLGQLYLQKGDIQTGFTYLQRASETAQEARLRDMALRLIKENGGQ